MIISLLSRSFGSMRAMRQGLAGCILYLSGAAYGQSSSDYAALSAEMQRTYPPDSEETLVHGGVRAENTSIICKTPSLTPEPTRASTTPTLPSRSVRSASVAPKGTLESFQVADALTCGGYFEF